MQNTEPVKAPPLLSKPMQELLERLPPVEKANTATLSSGYGADYVVARYCGLSRPPVPPLGLWQHGWNPASINFDPAAVIGASGSYEGQKESERFWVARRDQEEYLRQQGYQGAKAIGLPVVYVEGKPVERIAGSLLVMPVHSLEYTTHSWNFAEYVAAIEAVRDRFSEVVICVHPSCYTRGYWVNDFKERGFTIIPGNAVTDKNSLERLHLLMNSFEYITTNGFGSHLVYAAYWGAKISLFAPYAEFRESDYANTPLYQACPQILKPIIEATSQAGVQSQYPFLFVEPDQATDSTAWGQHEVGLDCKVSPHEIQRLFGWTQPQVSWRVAQSLVSRGARRLGREAKTLADTLSPKTPQAVAPASNTSITGTGSDVSQTLRTKILGRVAPVYGPVLGHGFKWLSSRAYRSQHHELERLRHWPARKIGVAQLLPYPVEFLDAASFLSIWREIYERRLYDFESDSASPRILDGGANIGLASLFWKSVYPQARITAFEPDPEISAVLERNLAAGGVRDVEIVSKALWNADTRLSFVPDDSDGGYVTVQEPFEKGVALEVKATRLWPYLQEEIDFLKLDIEGAETVVLRDCATALHRIKRLFIEYHGFPDQPQELPEMLLLLKQAGFRLHVQSELHSMQPFRARLIDAGMDNRVNIFAWRENS